MKNEKGVATLFVLISGLFFIAFIIGILVLSSAKKEAQLGLSNETQEIYDQTNQKDIRNIVPIYTMDHLLKMGSKEEIAIEQEGNKKYIFSEDAEYVLYNNIELNHQGILNLEEFNLDKGKNTIKIQDTSKEEEIYYYYKSNYNYPVTKRGIKYDGLVLQYDGVENTAEGHSNSTQTWKDLSGNQNEGTLINFNYSPINRWNDNSLSFNGIDNYITIQNNPIYTEDDYTMHFVVETDEIKDQTLFCNRAVLGEGRTAFMLNNNVIINNGSASTQWETQYNVATNIPMDICIVRDNVAVKLYINGELVKYNKTIGDKTSVHANISTIGVSQIQANLENQISNLRNYFSGRIYFVNIYNKALTDTEIKNNYKATKTPISEINVPEENLPEVRFDPSNTGGGKSFNLGEIEFNANNQTFYTEINVEQIDGERKNENIISIGQDFSNWKPSNTILGGVNLHIYYPNSAGNIIVSPVMQGEGFVQFERTYSKVGDDATIKIAFNSNGLYINGKMVINSIGMGNGITFFDRQTARTVEEFLQIYFQKWSSARLNIEIGSKEGENRSYGQYKAVEIYKGIITAEEMIELTKIKKDQSSGQEDQTSEQEEYTEILNAQYVPEGKEFVFDIPNFNNLGLKTLYTEIDLSTIPASDRNEGILSVGHDIKEWLPKGERETNIHFFYPNDNGNLILGITMLGYGHKQWEIPKSILNVENEKLKIAINTRGIYINGVEIASYDSVNTNAIMFGATSNEIESKFLKEAFNRLCEGKNIFVGSKEGLVRSKAIYDKVRIYNSLISSDEMIELTN